MSDRAFIVRQQVIRRAILGTLYVLRREKKNGYYRDLTHTLGHAPEECEFALDYLNEAGLVSRQFIHCRITAQGITHFESEE